MSKEQQQPVKRKIVELTPDEKERAFVACRAAIHHVLNAIADDPRKFWLMGDMTGSYEKLTEAASLIWKKEQDAIRADFRPKKEEWERYCADRERDERLLLHCREFNIAAE